MQAVMYGIHFELHCGTWHLGVEAALNPTLGGVLGVPFESCRYKNFEIATAVAASVFCRMRKTHASNCDPETCTLVAPWHRIATAQAHKRPQTRNSGGDARFLFDTLKSCLSVCQCF